MSAVKITVKDTITKLKEKNPNPRRICNTSELNLLVEALASDTSYVAKNTKIKGGQFITEDLQLAGDFRKGIIDLIKQLGLNTKEAEAAIEKYKVPKSLASAIKNIVNHANFLYMKDIGKGVNLIGESDVQQTIFFRRVDEKSHRIPKTRDGKEPAHSKVKVKSHTRLAIKSKVNPSFKELLK